MLKLRALGNMVIVQPLDQKEQTKSGIYIPQISLFKNIEGIVMSIGKEYSKNGKEIQDNIYVGDLVVYDYKSADPFELNGIKYLFVPKDAILAKTVMDLG